MRGCRATMLPSASSALGQTTQGSSALLTPPAFRPFPISIALLWTVSHNFMSFPYCGAQNCTQCWRWGCTAEQRGQPSPCPAAVLGPVPIRGQLSFLLPGHTAGSCSTYCRDPQAPFHRAALHPLVPLWLSSECCDQQRRVWLEAVTSGVPQGAVLGLAMFNVSISDLDEGMGSPLSRFGDRTKLGAASDSQEGRAAIQ